MQLHATRRFEGYVRKVEEDYQHPLIDSLYPAYILTGNRYYRPPLVGGRVFFRLTRGGFFAIMLATSRSSRVF